MPAWRGIRDEHGVVHAFRVGEAQMLRWKARCGARRWLGPDRADEAIDHPVDCMTCLVHEARS